MEPKGSFLCSLESTTGSCPEQDESIPQLPTLFP